MGGMPHKRQAHLWLRPGSAGGTHMRSNTPHWEGQGQTVQQTPDPCPLLSPATQGLRGQGLTSSNSVASFCRSACSSPRRASVCSSCVFSCVETAHRLWEPGRDPPPRGNQGSGAGSAS